MTRQEYRDREPVNTGTRKAKSSSGSTVGKKSVHLERLSQRVVLKSPVEELEVSTRNGKRKLTSRFLDMETTVLMIHRMAIPEVQDLVASGNGVHLTLKRNSFPMRMYAMSYEVWMKSESSGRR